LKIGKQVVGFIDKTGVISVLKGSITGCPVKIPEDMIEEAGLVIRERALKPQKKGKNDDWIELKLKPKKKRVVDDGWPD
jgi:hypothetical protein